MGFGSYRISLHPTNVNFVIANLGLKTLKGIGEFNNDESRREIDVRIDNFFADIPPEWRECYMPNPETRRKLEKTLWAGQRVMEGTKRVDDAEDGDPKYRKWGKEHERAITISKKLND